MMLAWLGFDNRMHGQRWNSQWTAYALCCRRMRRRHSIITNCDSRRHGAIAEKDLSWGIYESLLQGSEVTDSRSRGGGGTTWVYRG